MGYLRKRRLYLQLKAEKLDKLAPKSKTRTHLAV